METLILWIGFFGAWLLFAGPIYQAVLELKGEDIEFDRIREVMSQIPLPEKVSSWWWLIPPIKLYFEFRNRLEFQKQYVRALSEEDVESMVNFRSKASAWLLVAVGGFCIACKETYELGHHDGWSMGTYAGVIVLMLVLSIVNLILQMKRAERIKRL